MVRQVDAIFSQGGFRLLEPFVLPEGTRVHLSIEVQTSDGPAPPAAKLHTPKLANADDAADFVMEVRETDNAGV